MPLHPDLEAFLELAELGREQGRPALHELPPAEARVQYDATARMLEGGPVEVDQVRDLPIPCRDGHAIAARLYRPAGLATPAPVLLYFHGGGYCVGGLDSHDALCRALAALTPCAVLSVAYRLAPEHRFPTAFHDARDSHDWLRREAATLGLDTERIAIGGDSAGATLATTLCLALRDEGQPLPSAQVLLYPCTASEQDSPSHQAHGRGLLLESDTLQWMFGHYLRSPDDRSDWRFAPLQAERLEALPPAFIALAEYDPLRDEGLAYGDKLARAGVPVRTRVYEGMVHDFARLADITNGATQVREDIATVLASAWR
jgi:acetyl esterase